MFQVMRAGCGGIPVVRGGCGWELCHEWLERRVWECVGDNSTMGEGGCGMGSYHEVRMWGGVGPC